MCEDAEVYGSSLAIWGGIKPELDVERFGLEASILLYYKPQAVLKS